MTEPERSTRASLDELLSEDPATEVLPADDPYADEGGMLSEDDYLLEQPRRLSRLTIVLLVALIFLCGFVAGVLATRAVVSLPRSSAASAVVLTLPADPG